MTKWKAVFIGFILAVIVKSFFAHYEFIGLLFVGFITGYLARDGAIGGLWNAAVAGALGTIISEILFVFISTIGGSLFGIFAGLTGFSYLIYYAIVMGITGALGGLMASKE